MKPLLYLKKVVVYLLICFVCSSVYANNTLDSLNILLDQTSNDIERYDLMEKYIDEQEKLDRAKTIPHVHSWLALAKKIGDPAKIAKSHRALGYNYLLLNKNDSSLYFLQLALPHFQEIKDSSSISKVLNNYALIYQRTNKYEKAIKAYHEVIKMSNSIDEYYVELAALVNVASLQINQNNHEQAVEYLKTALKRYNQIPKDSTELLQSINDNQLGSIFINLGIAYTELLDEKNALNYFDKALEVCENNKNEFYRKYLGAYIHTNIGHIYWDREDWQTAHDHYKYALNESIDISNPQGMVLAKTSLGGTLVKLHRYDEANEVLMDGLDQAKEHNIIEEVRDAYKWLAENAKAQLDYKTGIEYYEQFIIVKDSIVNDERDKIQIAEREKWDTERKEDEILDQQQIILFEQQQQQTQQLIFLLSMIGVIGLGFLIYSRYKLRKERQSAEFEKNLNVAMARFVPTEFIESLGRDQITEVQLGDQIEKEITVIFTDIRNFTSRSEKMNATETFQFVKNYAEEIGPIIQANGGFINQYLGDGVMAVFQNNPEDALIACIEMHERLRTYNIELEAQGIEPIEVGMGLHTGPAVMGIIGDERRRDAAMISDTINTAARMESKTKQYGVKILISEESRLKLNNPELYKLRHIGNVLVKGKEKPVELYECFNGDNEYEFQTKMNTINEFNNAIELFYNEDYINSYDILSKIKNSSVSDKVVDSFLKEISNINPELKELVSKEQVLITS